MSAPAVPPRAIMRVEPEYRFNVAIDVEKHVIEGTVRVELPDGDPRVGQEWRFHLPPNRFLAVDPRGKRRSLESTPFERRVREEDLDPLLPRGFTAAGIEILSARDDRGRLDIAYEANPQIPKGYFTGNAVMRVRAADGRALHSIILQFRTRLPNRYVEGWSESGLFLEQWYPSLANWMAGGWNLDPNVPRASRFAGQVSMSATGWLAMGPGLLTRAEPGAVLSLPEDLSPARSLPLVFLSKAEGRVFTAGDGQGFSFFVPGGERLDRISRTIAERFVGYLKSAYGLTMPELRSATAGNLVLVQWDLPFGDIRALGHIVLIPKVHRYDDSLLDRVYTAKLTRAIAELWFGGTVWADEDKESWLSLGVPGFLALDFYASLWGWDGRVHSLTDWLNPRYREHFLEAPVREILYGDQDAPLLISMTGYPYERSALVVGHFKSVLVLRMLSFVVGETTFRHTLATMYREFNHRTATHTDFARIAERESGLSLDWFFDDWFRGKPRMDFQIEDWKEVPSITGHAVEVTVRRKGIGRMPIEVQATDILGGRVSARYEGTEEVGSITLVLAAEVTSIHLDPMEYLIEVERRNNESSPQIKLRPFYDWAKQSEVLVTMQGVIGGNAIDGNYAGLGVSIPINSTNSIDVIPIYGEHTQWTNYQISWGRSQFLLPRMNLGISAQKLGGTTSQAATVSYSFLTPDWLRISTGGTARLERVEALTRPSGDTEIVQSEGPNNNLGSGTGIAFIWSEAARTSFGVGFEHSDPGLTSNFTYTRWDGSVSQSYTLNPDNDFNFALIRTGIEGNAPIQKQILIGGPGLLRGYPRTVNLIYEQAVAIRASYTLALARGIWGSTVQMRKVSTIFFADVGKGWDNQQSPNDVKQRQDVGIGFEIRVSTIGVVEFPIRIDVAVPVNDDQYKTPQIILFEALAFF